MKNKKILITIRFVALNRRCECMVSDAMSLDEITRRMFHRQVFFLACCVEDGSFVSMAKSLREEGVGNGSFLLLY